MLFGSNRQKPVPLAPGEWGSNRVKAEVKPPKTVVEKPKADAKPKTRGKTQS